MAGRTANTGRARMKRHIALMVLILIGSNSYADAVGDCAGSPQDAVLKLPQGMQEFAQLTCTPFGHIIMQKDGWTWTYPGGVAPILIASQTTQANPQQLGNNSYFRSIEFDPVAEDEKVSVLAALGLGTLGPDKDPEVFRLTTSNHAGEESTLYLSFDARTDTNWGVWCNDECLPDSRFTLQRVGEASP